MSIKIVFEDDYIKKALQSNIPGLKYEEIDINEYSDQRLLAQGQETQDKHYKIFINKEIRVYKY
ncbi:hypothetical protein ACTNEW_10905 [Blautia sp. HCP3S3_G3]|uniref:hypothetical protein n=1 Tax=Blautia sp. HCP3S3_G3 TaxID=3438913 RepID=UPI003F8A7051